MVPSLNLSVVTMGSSVSRSTRCVSGYDDAFTVSLAWNAISHAFLPPKDNGVQRHGPREKDYASRQAQRDVNNVKPRSTQREHETPPIPARAGKSVGVLPLPLQSDGRRADNIALPRAVRRQRVRTEGGHHLVHVKALTSSVGEEAAGDTSSSPTLTSGDGLASPSTALRGEERVGKRAKETKNKNKKTLLEIGGSCTCDCPFNLGFGRCFDVPSSDIPPGGDPDMSCSMLPRNSTCLSSVLHRACPVLDVFGLTCALQKRVGC
jgi:hypothetical protein